MQSIATKYVTKTRKIVLYEIGPQFRTYQGSFLNANLWISAVHIPNANENRTFTPSLRNTFFIFLDFRFCFLQLFYAASQLRARYKDLSYISKMMDTKYCISYFGVLTVQLLLESNVSIRILFTHSVIAYSLSLSRLVLYSWSPQVRCQRVSYILWWCHITYVFAYICE